MDKDKVAPALGKIPSGIYIATSILEDRPVGMLSSFVEQAGFDPPAITIAVQPGRILQAALEETGSLGLNILGDSDHHLMKPFSSSDNENPFAEVPLTENDHGVPQLTEALAFLACKITGSVAAGDHIVYVAEVIDGILQDAEATPMVRIRKNGFGY